MKFVLALLVLASIQCACAAPETYEDDPDCWVFRQRGRRISGNNDKILRNVASEDDCAQACVDESDFACASIEYKAKYSKCFLSTATRESAGSAFGAARGMTYKERTVPCGEEEIVDPCLENPCQNGGACVATDASYMCSCVDGFEGDNCETVVVNPCDAAPCQNGGDCVAEVDSYTCICPTGYKGEFCETEGPCVQNPCQNGGQCAPVEDTYTCICVAGYEGNECETESYVDPCLENPCQNGGQCTSGDDGITCDCASNFMGDLCQIGNVAGGKPTYQISQYADYTPSSNAVDGNTDTNMEVAKSCATTQPEATPWFVVDLQQTYNIRDVKLYSRSDCCTNQLADPIVATGMTFDQERLERFDPEDYQVCATSPGEPGLGEAVTLGCRATARYLTVYTFNSVALWMTLCEFEVFAELSEDPCSLSPCLNGGQCSSSENSFTCDCPQEYTGDYCNIASRDVNIAIDQPTYMSSVYSDYSQSPKCVDGFTQADMEVTKKCCVTTAESLPWFVVDLEKTYPLHSVKLYARSDCCPNQSGGLTVGVGANFNEDNFDPQSYPVCATYPGDPATGEVLTLQCNAVGRYLTVYAVNPSPDFLTLCEVEVFADVGADLCTKNPCQNGGQCTGNEESYRCDCPQWFHGENCEISDRLENLALGMTTYQSSLYQDYSQSPKCVDGSTLQDMEVTHSCCVTGPEEMPWWVVDLGREQEIHDVSLYSRNDCCESQMANSIVATGSTWNPEDFDPRSYTTCATYTGSPAIGEVLNLDCRATARYLTVYALNSPANYMTICEVEVYGRPNLALGKTTYQSSLYQDYSQSPKCVDGSTLQDMEVTHSCCVTGSEAMPWWVVDLGEEKEIHDVTLYPRNDYVGQMDRPIVATGATFDPENFDPRDYTTCASFTGTPVLGQVVKLDCRASARYLTVYSLNSPDNYMTICEVEVY